MFRSKIPSPQIWRTTLRNISISSSITPETDS